MLCRGERTIQSAPTLPGERGTVHLPQTWVWPFLLMLNMARQFCTCLLTRGRKTCPQQGEHVSVPSGSVVDAPTLKQPRCSSAGEEVVTLCSVRTACDL